MGCGCGKGKTPAAKNQVSQVRSATRNNPPVINVASAKNPAEIRAFLAKQNKNLNMDKGRLTIEKKRRDAIAKKLNRP